MFSLLAMCTLLILMPVGVLGRRIVSCMVQIVRAWLLEVSVLVRRYKDELLSAVLDLLLSAPSIIFPPQVC